MSQTEEKLIKVFSRAKGQRHYMHETPTTFAEDGSRIPGKIYDIAPGRSLMVPESVAKIWLDAFPKDIITDEEANRAVLRHEQILVEKDKSISELQSQLAALKALASRAVAGDKKAMREVAAMLANATATPEEPAPSE